MIASLRALLAEIIDYAGLFPPTKLPLDAAIRRFAVGRQGADAWMLSRFIVPAARLGELTFYRDELFTRNPPFPFSVLGRGGVDADTLRAGVQLDLADVEAFLERCGRTVAVNALELKLASELLSPPDAPALEKLFDGVGEIIDSRPGAPVTVYYEAPPGPDWRRTVPAILEALARRRPAAGPGDPSGAGRVRDTGFKLRCGGAEAQLIPPVELVAFVIGECRNAGVPFKATAGLHHPVRRMDHELLAKGHGFLNLFGAAVLAHARRLDEAALTEVLEDEDPHAFVFEDRQFRWRDQIVTAAEIAQARTALARSFGSCSFDDPRDGLIELGLA